MLSELFQACGMCSFALLNELNRVNVICFVADDDRDNQQKYVLEILIFFVLHSIVKCNIFLCYFFPLIHSNKRVKANVKNNLFIYLFFI